MKSNQLHKIMLISILFCLSFTSIDGFTVPRSEFTIFVAAEQTDFWQKREPTLKVGGYGECVVGTGDLIYVMRAYSTGNCWFGSYNPSNDEWTTILEWLPPDKLPRPKSGLSMAWDYDDYIYVLFGASYSDSDRTYFYRYQISKNTWEELATSPHTQGSGNAITWSGYDENIYAFLGDCDGSIFAQFTPLTNSWKSLHLDWACTDDGASLVWTGKECLYALRGEWEENSPHTETAMFDIASGVWLDVTNIPVVKGVGDGGSMLWLGYWLEEYSESIFVLSGNDVDENPGYDFLQYQINHDDWIVLASLNYPVGYYDARARACIWLISSLVYRLPTGISILSRKGS